MIIRHLLKLLTQRASRRRAGRVVLAFLVGLVLVGAVLAYYTATGSGTTAASVGALGTPTITTATPGAGTVALSWSTVSAPAGGSVTYFVTRTGGTVGGNCPSSQATATTATSCTDSGLTKGTYTYTVTAVWQSWTTTSSSASATLSSGALDHFSVSAPASTTAGTAFTATITAQDASNNTVTAYSGSQAIAFSGPSSSPSGNGPSYPATVSFTSGVGTASITLYDAQSTTLTATQGTVTGTSGSFTVAAGANHQIAASASSPQTAGTAFNVTLTAQDSWGNATGNLSGSKSVSFSGPSSSPNHSTPTYPATVTFTSGVGTASVTLVDAQTTTVTANDTTDGLNGTASNSITVNPAGASSFTVPTPSTQTAGSAFNETLTALDAFGNTATGYSGSQAITFTGPSNSPNNTKPVYPASVTFTSGVGTASITLFDAQNTTLTATQGTVTGTSGSFTVAAGANNQIGASASSPQTAGTAFNLTLTAQDSWGNPTGNLSGSKSVTFSGPSSSPSNKGPSYPTTVSFSAGSATASVTLYDAQTTTITANDTTDSLNGTASNNITVNAGANNQIGASASSPQTTGTAFNVTLTAQDTWGNTTGNLSGSKSVTFSGPAHSPNNTAPTYPATVTFTSGVGTASVTLFDAQTTTITANDTTDSLNGTASNNITVNAVAQKLLFTSAALSAATSLSANMGPITVQEQDNYGNVTTTAETVNLSSNTTGTASFSTTKNGSNVTSVSIPGGSSSASFYYGDTKSGTPTITAAATGLTSATQQETVTLPVGLGITVAPSGSTGTPSVSCGSPSASYTCNVTGVGNGGHVTFYVTFVDANGNQSVYSTTSSSTITESGQSSGTVAIAAGAASSSPNTLTASHTGGATKTSTLTFGSFTLTINVSS